MSAKATLTAEEAAEYLGMNVKQFRRAVTRGELPKAFIHSRPARWSRVQLDWALEGRMEHAQPPEHDPIMEHLIALGRDDSGRQGKRRK